RKHNNQEQHNMQKSIMQKTGSVFFLLAALTASAQTSVPGQPVTAAIDVRKTGQPIPPFVYGQFLEHGGSLVYSSLWCELLDDRKFYYAVQPKPAEDPNVGQRGFGGFGPGRRRNVGAGGAGGIRSARLVPW